MPDQSAHMSPAAILVMAVVVLVLAGVWLGAVFLAARQPADDHRMAEPQPQDAGRQR
jgi:hypothetical protein